MPEKKKHTIAVLPGDGIGPEIMREALKILEAVKQKYSLDLEMKQALIGGAAYDRYRVPLPEETLEVCQQADAILLGSIGGPKWDHLPPDLKPELGGLLAMRRMLNLYANLRPITVYEELKDICPLSPRILTGKIDLVTVRELTHGIYFGQPRGSTETEGIDTMRYRKEEVEKIARLAFSMAEKRRKKVTSIDKANVLHSSMLWRKTVTRVATGFPDIELNHLYVDNAAMQLILNPQQFDVILTTNLFGDILSDESAALSGSLGMLPSASLGDSTHLYEPAGGSAPDIAGKGIANPIAQILSVAMMLDYSLNLQHAARDISSAVRRALKDGHRTRDIATPGSDTVSTREMGDAIRNCL
ncbi:MAG: 3-isopropylmalate dehydrogenase [Candidatus Aminicenantes bacterium]|nr:3-isopropylmalate dehydrogenase [Candidatus Aminicenantes bacterium]